MRHSIRRRADAAARQRGPTPKLCRTLSCHAALLVLLSGCAGAPTHGKNSFVHHPVEPAPPALNPAHATALPPPSARSSADFTLFNLDWRGHRAKGGLVLRPLGGVDLAAIPASGAGYGLGLYVSDEWRLQPSLSATLDLRLEHRLAGSSYLRPRAELRWSAAADTTVRAYYGRDQRSPLLDASGGRDTALNLSPWAQREQGEMLELAAEHRLVRDLKLQAAAYAWTVHDVAVTTSVPDSPLLQVRQTTVNTRGVALSAVHAWAAGARVRGSAMLQEAVDDDGLPLPGAPRLLGKLVVSTPLPWAGLNLSYEWLYGGSCLGPDSTVLDARAVSNLSLGSAALGAGVDLSVSVFNLFDTREPMLATATDASTAFSHDGRSLRLAVGYRF